MKQTTNRYQEKKSPKHYNR